MDSTNHQPGSCAFALLWPAWHPGDAQCKWRKYYVWWGWQDKQGYEEDEEEEEDDDNDDVDDDDETGLSCLVWCFRFFLLNKPVFDLISSI